MTQFHWKSQISDVFSNSADWNPTGVPASGDDAILDAAGSTAYTVTANTSETVTSIQTASTATLAITGGTFTASAGAGTGANAGAISVGNNTAFSVDGTLSNGGTISLNSVGNGTDFLIGATGATLTGAGKVTLSDNGNNFILGAAASDTLTNVNNTISGAGQLGDGQMTLVNEASGVIDASAANNALVLETSGETVTNAGTIEATGAAGLSLTSTTVNSSTGGVIQAVGSTVRLASADLMGGALKSSGGGAIGTSDRGTLLDGTNSHAVTNTADLVVNNNTSLSIQGSIVNSSTGGGINMASVGNGTDLVVTASGATLSGGGKVTLSDNGNNFIVAAGAGDVLTNVDNTIQGAGQIGGGPLRFINDKSGVVDATAANNALVIDSFGQWFTNGGLVEATGTAGLTIVSTTMSNAFGVIQAVGSTVRMTSADILGGSLKSSSGGVITTTDRGTLLDGTSTHAITNQANFVVANNTSLNIQGSITSNSGGLITLASVGNATQLVTSINNATLAAGTVAMSDNTNNFVMGTLYGPLGSQHVSTLVNDGTISGAGNIGANLLLTNNGVIDATLTNGIAIKTGNTAVAGSNVVTNNGTIESTNPGALTAVGGVVTTSITIDNNASTGVIEANGAHTHINLHSTTIVGGTLITLAGGAIESLDRGSLLDGTASGNPINNQGAVRVLNNTSLSIQGTINNTGSFALQSVGNGTDLVITAVGALLTGAGVVTLSDNGNNFIVGDTAASTLTNVNNTISGGGQLGDGELTLVNQASGVIDANTASNALVLNTGSVAVTNAGLIEATGTAGLNITGTAVNDSSGGVIQAANSVVRLTSADLIGGTLKTSSSGAFVTQDRGSLLDGTTSTVNNQGVMDVSNNTSLSIQGTINNTGSINLQSVGNGTDLVVTASNATLTGGGVVVLSDNGNNFIVGSAAASTLTNVNNTISGAGQLGDGQLTLVNQASGIIDANAASNALVIDTGTVAVTNAGLIEATGAGGLNITSTTVNNGTAGVIQAVGSVVRLTTADIAGGTLKTSGGGDFATQDRGSLLDGTTNILNNTGTVNVSNNTSLSLQGAIHNSGSINLQSVGNGTDLVVTASNATLSYAGKVNLSDNGNNFIVAGTAGAKLTNYSDTISGAGQIGGGPLVLVNDALGVIDASATNNALVLSTGADAITNSGLIEATGAGGLNISGCEVNDSSGGTIQAVGSVVRLGTADLFGGTLKTSSGGDFATQDQGSLFDGTSSTVNNQGVVNVSNNTSLSLQGTINNTGSINLQSVGNGTDLVITASNATLTGGGSISLSDNGNNFIVGATAASKLTLSNGAISGAGQLGDGQMTLAIGASGSVNATGNNALVVNTGANAITNAGLMEASGAGGMSVQSAVTNTGVLEANGGVLDVTQAVTGAGTGTIVSGTLEFGSSFTENVTFTGTSGTLDLAQSQGYAGSVTGFAQAGGTFIDLRDISFVSSGEATFSGTTTSGTLKVTDGTRTANITLIGNYTGSAFVAQSDGHGGTLVHDPSIASLENATVHSLDSGLAVHASAIEAASVHPEAAETAGMSLDWSYHTLGALHAHGFELA